MMALAQRLLDGLTVLAATTFLYFALRLVWRNATRLKGCLLTLLVAIGLLAAGLLGVLVAQEDGGPAPAMAFALSASRLVLLASALAFAIAALLLLLVPKLRPFGLVHLQRVLRWPEARDFAAARAATGHAGSVIEAPRLRVWTDLPAERHGIFAETLQRTREATAGATGLSIDRLPPLRVLAFDDGAGFHAYGGRLGRVFERAGGYAMRFPRPVVIVHREAVEIIRPSLDWVLSHEFAHYLTHGAMGPIREVWLSEGLAMYLPSLALETHPRSVKPTRILQAAIARGDMPSPKVFLAANYLRLKGLDAQSARGKRRSEAAGQITLYYFMSGAFVRYLHRRDAAAFQRYLRGYRRAGASKRHFKACFGVRPERALQDHIDHVAASQAPPIRRPLPEECARIEAEFIHPLREPSTALDKRIEILDSYGLIAAVWGISAVVDQLEIAETGRHAGPEGETRFDAEERRLLATAARRALENSAGALVSEEAAGWRAWARGLKPGLLGPFAL